MSLVIKRSDNDEIVLPTRLLAALNLREGDAVSAVVDGQTLHLTPLQTFLSLRGALADDEAFDRAMESLDQAWQAWTTTTSA